MATANRFIAGALYQQTDKWIADPTVYTLKLLIAPSHFSYAVIEPDGSTLFALQPFQLERITKDEVNMQALNNLLESHQVLKSNFKGKKIGFYTPVMTLAPGKLYDKVMERQLLSFNTHLSDNDLIFSDELKNSDANLVYGIPEHIYFGLKNLWPDVEIHHAFSSLLDFLIRHSDAVKHRLYVYIQPDSLQIIYLKEGVLRFVNSFSYQSPEDFVYYLLFVCRQLHLEPEKLTLTIMGEIMRESAICQLTNKYFFETEFIGYHPKCTFREDYPLPGHFFFNLLGL
jgi:hypothetical protein